MLKSFHTMAEKYLIVGAGFSGAVLAQQLATNLHCEIDIWDERAHIGGNCHTERDEETGIMTHQYGPHIFNTDKKAIWDYVNRFGEFKQYIHRVKGVHRGEIFSLPINLSTINQYFKKQFTPQEAEEFLTSIADHSINDPQNFEEQALKFIGKELYEAFFKGYTQKHWGTSTKDLPASILKRIPVRFNYRDDYHLNEYSGIPVDGYTAIIEKMMAAPNITVTLNKKFSANMDEVSQYNHVFYTGPLDAYFDFKEGRLSYRTVTFEKFYAEGDYQGAAQLNYCDEEIPYTRIVEHKHFTPWETHEKTICIKEFSKETAPGDVPYYPKRLAADKKLLTTYRNKAEQLAKVSFLGRLATYRYMDMHHVIGEAIQMADQFIEANKNGKKLPVFPNQEF